MKVLVAVASKHGSTRQIGEAIAVALADAGVETTLRAPEEVADLAGFDAVLVGSGVYIGKWLAPARQFVEGHLDELRARPLWFFSSGPLGDPPKPPDDPLDIAELVRLVEPRGHRLFAGNLDRSSLAFGERAVTRMVGAPYGDFRDWPEIRAWAGEIADALGVAPVAAARA